LIAKDSQKDGRHVASGIAALDFSRRAPHLFKSHNNSGPISEPLASLSRWRNLRIVPMAISR
jgi:hypothetical protein